MQGLGDPVRSAPVEIAPLQVTKVLISEDLRIWDNKYSITYELLSHILSVVVVLYPYLKSLRISELTLDF
jgi:hypothetical protein